MSKQWSGDRALNEDVAQVIDADLERSGQFKSLKRSLMLSFPFQKEDVYFRDWQYLATEYLVIGQVVTTDTGGLSSRLPTLRCTTPREYRKWSLCWW